MTMNKILISMLLLLCSIYSQAQTSVEPLKFLGTPIDGSKAEMIKALKSKGFVLNDAYGTPFYEGVFNGDKVSVFVDDYRGKVWRVYVACPSVSESEIKIRFNNLVAQFNSLSDKYLPLDSVQIISDDENIGYNILVHHKRYVSRYVKKLSDEDHKKIVLDIRKKYSDDWSDNNNLTAEQFEVYKAELYDEYLKVLMTNEVWFMIHKDNRLIDSYNIGIYYDNNNNYQTSDDL